MENAPCPSCKNVVLEHVKSNPPALSCPSCGKAFVENPPKIGSAQEELNHAKNNLESASKKLKNASNDLSDVTPAIWRAQEAIDRAKIAEHMAKKAKKNPPKESIGMGDEYVDTCTECGAFESFVDGKCSECGEHAKVEENKGDALDMEKLIRLQMLDRDPAEHIFGEGTENMYAMSSLMQDAMTSSEGRAFVRKLNELALGMGAKPRR